MQDIYDILAKHFTGESSPDEEAKVAEWKLNNKEEYAQLSELWDMVPDAIDKDHAFKTYGHKAALSKIEPRLNNKPKTKVFRLNNMFKYAAAASVVLLVGLTSVWFLTKNNFTTVTNNGSTAMEVDLPDGSTVWLAENSSIDYTKDFKEHRDLKLKGEAFFEVEADKKHPFVIETTHGEIEVLGTAFNVEVEESKTAVSVDHGLVAFRNKGKEIKLSKGQFAESVETGISEVAEVDENYASWRTGVFHFDETPLSEVVDLMNGYYEKKIIIERTSKIGETITGEFNQESVDVLIDAIVLTCGLEAEYGEKTIRLK